MRSKAWALPFLFALVIPAGGQDESIYYTRSRSYLPLSYQYSNFGQCSPRRRYTPISMHAARVQQFNAQFFRQQANMASLVARKEQHRQAKLALIRSKANTNEASQ